MKNCVLVTEWAVNGGRQFKFARQGISGSLHEAALFTLGQESLPVFPQGCLETGQTQTGFWHVSSVGLTPLERSPFLRAGWLSQKMSQPEKVWDPKCFLRRIAPILKSEYWRMHAECGHFSPRREKYCCCVQRALCRWTPDVQESDSGHQGFALRPCHPLHSQANSDRSKKPVELPFSPGDDKNSMKSKRSGKNTPLENEGPVSVAVLSTNTGNKLKPLSRL